MTLFERGVSATVEISTSLTEGVYQYESGVTRTYYANRFISGAFQLLSDVLRYFIPAHGPVVFTRIVPRLPQATLVISASDPPDIIVDEYQSPVQRTLYAYRTITPVQQVVVSETIEKLTFHLYLISIVDGASTIINDSLDRMRTSIQSLLSDHVSIDIALAGYRIVPAIIDALIEIGTSVSLIKKVNPVIPELLEIQTNIERWFYAIRAIPLQQITVNSTLGRISYLFRNIDVSATLDGITSRVLTAIRPLGAEPLGIDSALTKISQINRSLVATLSILTAPGNIRIIPRTILADISVAGNITLRHLFAFRTILGSAQISSEVSHLDYFIRIVPASASVNSAVSRLRTVFRNPLASLIVSLDITHLRLIPRDISASCSISSDISRIKIITRGIFDLLTLLTADLSRLGTFMVSNPGVLSINSAVQRTRTALGTISVEVETINDSVSRIYTAIRVVSIADTIASAVNRTRSAAGAIEIGQSLIIDTAVQGLRNVRFFHFIIEPSLAIDSSVDISKKFFRTIIQSLIIETSPSRISTFFRSLPISLSLSDSVDRLRIIPRDVIASLTVDSQSVFIKIYQRLISASAMINDAAVRSALHVILATASVTLDAVVSYIRIVPWLKEEFLTVVDTPVRRLLAIVGPINEAITMNEGVGRFKTLLRNIPATTIVSDSVDGFRLTFKVIAIPIQNVIINSSVTHTILRFGIRMKTAIFDEKSGVSFFR